MTGPEPVRPVVLPTLGVYGTVYFANRQGRDRFAAQVAAAAAARGFVAGPWPSAGYEAGNVSVTGPAGSPGLRLCWLHTDPQVVDLAVQDLEANASGNGRNGEAGDVFGSGQVSQLSLAAYLSTV